MAKGSAVSTILLSAAGDPCFVLFDVLALEGPRHARSFVDGRELTERTRSD
jgi:hypothetical protein